jgi:cytidylate kinase
MAVASRLGLAYLDTGSMYRALCLACQRAGIDLDDRDAVAAFTAGVGLAPGTDPSAPSISIVTGGEPDAEVSEAIRDPAVSAAVSAVATNLAVRARLKTEQQQIIAEARRRGRGIVVEGRDITTVVAPDADVRLLLTADEQTRLARRAAQDEAGGARQSTEATRDQVLRRDAADATVSQFHTAADGVVTLDSSALTFDETVTAIVDLVIGAAADTERTMP